MNKNHPNLTVVQKPITISKSDMTVALFKNMGPGERIWHTYFKGSPKDSIGGLGRYGEMLRLNCEEDEAKYDALSREYSHYTACSTFKDAGYGRKTDNFASLHFIMLDDVKDDSELPLEPSYRLETSKGNYQVGYLLDKPCTDKKRAQALVKGLAAFEGNDSSGHNLVRMVRLNNSTNTKSDRAGFEIVLREWRPEVRYSMEELERVFPPAMVSDGVTTWSSSLFEDKVAELGRKLTDGDGRDELLTVYVGGLLKKYDADTALQITIGQVYQWFNDEHNEMIEKAKDKISRFSNNDSMKDRINRNGGNIVVGEEAEIEMGIWRMNPDDMRRKLVHLRTDNRVVHLDYRANSYPKGHMRDILAGNVIPPVPGMNNRPMPTFEVWASDPDRQQAENLVFAPGEGTAAFSPNGDLCVNNWIPIARTENEHAKRIARPFFEHIEWLFADRADEFLDWLAHIEQRPGELPSTAWLHVAPQQGLGRSWIANTLARVWRPYVNVGMELNKMMESDFNDSLANRLLSIVEEVREGGGERYRHAERLKALITDQERKINPKGRTEYTQKNCMRMLMFSNHINAIPLEATDRRIEVVECTDGPRDDDYYMELVRLQNTPEFINAVGLCLRDRDITLFNAGKRAKLTESKRSMIDVSKRREDRVVEAIHAEYRWPMMTMGFLLGALTNEPVTVNAAHEARRMSHYVNQFKRIGVTTVQGKKLTLLQVGPIPVDKADVVNLIDQGMPIERVEGIEFINEHLDEHDI